MCDVRLKQICPGALYCRLDDICVHLHQYCDGVTDCKLSGDDESMCDKRTCAEGCTCIGETMICTRMDKTKFKSYHNHFHGLYVATRVDILTDLGKFPDLFYLSVSDLNFKGESISRRYFESLVSLRALVLLNNTLPTIPGHFFGGLSNLLILDMKNNTMGTLHKFAFSGLMNVKQLNLSGQNIVTIYGCAFCDLQSLVVLDLSSNKIIELASGSLVVLKAAEINLTGNIIKTIHDHAFSQNVSLKFHLPVYCCFVQSRTECFPKTLNKKMLCDYLPTSKILLAILLMITVYLLIANSCVCMMYMKTKDSRFFLLQNLALSDGCLSLYVFGILSLLFTTDQSSVFALAEWKDSFQCTILSGIVALSILNSKTTCCLIVINYVLITKYALKKYSLGKYKQLQLLLIIWLILACVAFNYSYFIEFQTPFCVPFNASQKSSNVPVIFKTIFISYIMICDGLMVYFYVVVCRCLQVSAVKSGRPNTSCLKVRNRGISSCLVCLCSTFAVLLLSSQQLLNHPFRIKYELYIIMIIALAPMSNSFIYTFSNKLAKLKAKHGF